MTSLEQIEGLFEDLLSIFRVVHPAKGNLEAFGGAIRDIIILACTEVEAQWKGVLEAHNVQPVKGGFFTTRDYVKLLPVMKLNEYELKLNRYPWLPPTGPFIGWNPHDSTKSLPWYDAYNKVKHDRESEFVNATLRHAIEAVAACVVMLAAQFGLEALKRHDLKQLFEFVRRPEWDPKDWYYQPIPHEAWVQVRCPMPCAGSLHIACGGSWTPPCIGCQFGSIRDVQGVFRVTCFVTWKASGVTVRTATVGGSAPFFAATPASPALSMSRKVLSSDM